MANLNLVWKSQLQGKSNREFTLFCELNSFSIRPVIFCRLYQAFTESLRDLSFICWFHSLTLKGRNSVKNIVETCKKIPGVKQRDLTSFCNQQILQKADCILASLGRVLGGELSLLLSGHQYVVPTCKTNCFFRSFITSALKRSHSS